jgi:hypothetical protein
MQIDTKNKTENIVHDFDEIKHDLSLFPSFVVLACRVKHNLQPI